MKKKWIINIDEVPQNITIEKFIRHLTDINKHIENLKSTQPDYLSLSIDTPIDTLKKDLLLALKEINSYSFEYKGREEKFESYVSTSLTYNPQAIDNISHDPHQSGLGSKLYSEGSSDFYEASMAQKNTYADTYSYFKRTPLSHRGEIKNLLDSFERTLIRSRISIIKSGLSESTDLKYLWHKDESIFLNLRINIPIQSNENYVIQMIDDQRADAEIIEFELKTGKAFIYDTQKLHRPLCKNLNATDRINMICGVSPWFDYHNEQNAWISNEYYGEMHPFDMFMQGKISKLIKA